MAGLGARHLVSHGAKTILVCNRTHQRALELAEAFHGQAIPFERLHETVERADMVLTSTAAAEPLFRREHGEAILTKRKNRPMFFINISLPPNLHPNVNLLTSYSPSDLP